MAGEATFTPPLPQITPAGYHDIGQRANSGRFTVIMHQGYTWVRKALAGPGAMNYAFDSLELAESTPIGPGIRQRQFWNKTQAPLFVDSMMRPVSGYGGVAQGQMISQPLLDPYNNRYGNIMGPS